jgi:hypothetical protein
MNGSPLGVVGEEAEGVVSRKRWGGEQHEESTDVAAPSISAARAVVSVSAAEQ